MLPRAVSAATLLLLASILIGACGGSAVPTIPAVASQSASQAPVATGPADPTPVGGSQAPGTVIVALNIQFDPVAVAVPAGEPLTIIFDNRDPGVPHDLVIKDANGNEIAKTAIITGPAREQLGVGPLEPGAYPFVCTVHPNMVGTITAE